MDTTQETPIETPIPDMTVPQSPDKSKKVWVICIIALAVILVVGGAVAAVIMTKGNGDTDKSPETGQQQEGKDAKNSATEEGQNQEESTSTDDDEDEHERVEVADEDEDLDDEEEDEESAVDDQETVKSELDTYIKNKRKGYSYTYKINKLGLTSDQKYYYAYITVSISGGGHESSVEYRAAKDGEWAYVNGGQSVALCSDLDSDALNFMKTYGKEVVNYMSCYDGNSSVDYGQ